MTIINYKHLIIIVFSAFLITIFSKVDSLIIFNFVRDYLLILTELSLIYGFLFMLPFHFLKLPTVKDNDRNEKCKKALDAFYCLQEEFCKCNNNVTIAKDQINLCEQLIDEYRIFGTYHSPNWKNLITYYNKFEDILNILKS